MPRGKPSAPVTAGLAPDLTLDSDAPGRQSCNMTLLQDWHIASAHLPPVTTDPGDVPFEDASGQLYWLGPNKDWRLENPNKHKYAW